MQAQVAVMPGGTRAAPDYQSDLDAAPALGGAVGTSGSTAAAAAAGEPSLNPHSPISADLSGQRRPVGEGSVLGEAAFFTEVPQLEAVRSLTVCRVLVVGRATYASLERAFPHSARLVLHNLKRKAENAVAKEFRGRLKADELDELWAAFSRLQFGWASTELQDGVASMPLPSLDARLLIGIDLIKRARSPTQDDVASMSLPSLDHHDLGDIACWSPRQQQVMSNLLRIRAVAQQHISRQEVERTTEFLWAASQGNEAKVRQMLQQGCPADSADYDARTALELACVKGHAGVVDLLLAAGANVNLQDNLGSCAMLEACKYGHDDLISKLKRAGASLDGKRTVVEQAAMLCTAVFEGNLPLARRLLRAGVRVDSGDYDKRTALHISAAEGNLQAVRLLVEEGGADMQVADRWGHTPLDEALRVGAGPVVRYLTRQLGAHEAQAALASGMPAVAQKAQPAALASAATAEPGAAAHKVHAAAGAATAAAPEAAANGAAPGAAGRTAATAASPPAAAAPMPAKAAATASAAAKSEAAAAADKAEQPARRQSSRRSSRAGDSGSRGGGSRGGRSKNF
ncbi:hypothetical protein COHA_002834 [Chlorella ohadii]|uniref:Cyclic nucleotide-binding domain-containing protein n=1 Tax=Chlorella ohadii TaxID=2649997 RepID=A0AAD5H8G3_9CHLO|nr:hypothetical protein COHA_002834 [Chlorella ohadii]